MTSASPGRVAAKPNVARREGFEPPTPSCPNWCSCAVVEHGVGEARGVTQQLSKDIRHTASSARGAET